MQAPKSFQRKGTKLVSEASAIDKFRIKCRFRAVIRRVMENLYWLLQDVDEYEGDNVKIRVERAVRSTGKKPLLNIYDKALLNKAAETRTDKEKNYLYRIIGDLKCFRRYPRVVKTKLAAVAYYRYYGPGRTIVREDQEAHALYFIVNGDVTVSHLEWDEVGQQTQLVDLWEMHTGDMFGEVSLLHNIKRTATCITSSHCELLVVMKDDFKNVLQTSIQRQWDDIQTAMSRFTYFDSLDEVARREGCIVAKMKSYAENDTILGDGVGAHNYVYFVLSGQCQMIESLQIIVRKNGRRHFYTLYDPHVASDEIDEDFDVKYFSAYNKVNAKNNKESDANASRIDKNQYSNKAIVTRGSKNSEMRLSKESNVLKRTNQESRSSVIIRKDKERRENGRSGISGIGSQRMSGSLKSNILLKPEEHLEGHEDHKSSSVSSFKYSESKSTIAEPSSPENLKTFFMQVCQLKKGASFGFGENMRDRRIIALTPVDCMLLPKTWLLQRNTANIWTRVQHYLERKIPTKKQLFDEFVSSEQWQVFKNQVVQEVVSKNHAVNWTTVHDVPYSIRMKEMIHI